MEVVHVSTTRKKSTHNSQNEGTKTFFNPYDFYLLLVPPKPDAVLVPEEDEELEEEEGLE